MTTIVRPAAIAAPVVRVEAANITEGQVVSGAHIVGECLRREGVDIIFGHPGGAILPLYHVLPEFPVQHILCRHEQAAAMAADGWARMKGRPGVCMATSGPGATNLVTGLASAMMDSVPVVAITGNVPTGLLGTDAFQETDIVGISMPCTKHNYLVERVEDLATILRQAFHIAGTGRPGPVLVDIPKDVLTGTCEFRYPETVSLRGYKPTMSGNARQIKAAANVINQARKPLIIAGHGVAISGAFDELLTLAERADIPVTWTLLGSSTFPDTHRLSLGMTGLHGTSVSNRAICECDALIAIGMRMDDRVTGKVSGFAPNAKIVHVDIDPAEIGKNVKVHVPIVGDAKKVLSALVELVNPAERPSWHEQLAEFERRHPGMAIHQDKSEMLLPQTALKALSEVCDGEAIITTDVGQHQMWAARYIRFKQYNRFASSGGLGSMGFGLPSAMGAQFACPNDVVWTVVGDGGFQMNIQELATIAEHNLPVKICLLNNYYLGMVRQIQELFYQGRYSASYLGSPDFVKICDGYGLPAWRVTTPEECEPAIRAAMAHNGPALVEFVIDANENCFPMIPPGGTLFDLIEDPRD
ncbi:MAG: biosynthetic-type acetolactate synthase large subunit [Chloroflexi bacterium]|nr:biosynthetic-type acetolactate synthase large subunit [Chloroflexota bacterium]